jgi:hypothetical protein
MEFRDEEEQKLLRELNILALKNAADRGYTSLNTSNYQLTAMTQYDIINESFEEY